MEKAIVFENVTIRMADRVLFQNLNLTIHAGERSAFLGPNGIGKSLLLELIALGKSAEIASRYKGLSVEGAILDPEGRNFLSDNRTNKVIAYVKQDEEFYNNSTVLSEALTACNGAGIELDEERFDYYLKEFGILDKKKVKIKNNVSYGEGKLIHLITGLLKLETCNIMLLDEPLNHLSFQNSKKFNAIMKQEIDRNPLLTVIMVSHCRAMDFVNQAIVYEAETKSLSVKAYHAYDCFNTAY